MKKNRIFAFATALLTTCSVALADSAAQKEAELVKTKFADWTGVTLSDKAMDVNTQVITTKSSGEEISFTMTGVSVFPDGGTGKVSSMSDGYLCAMKQDSPNNATIETTAFSNVTTVSYFHRATGSNRGWGLQVKGDGDADWVTLYETVTNSTGNETGDIAVNRTNVQLRWFNLSYNNYAALSNLIIKGMVEEAPRSFQDFTIDLTKGTPVLPEGVEQVSYSDHEASDHGDSHGWCWYAIKFDVDGPVKFSVGGCQYTGELAYVTDASGNKLGTIDTKTAGCYHNGGIATWTYNSMEANTLTLYCGQYCPFIQVEACDYVDNVTVAYYDQNNKKLGDTEVAPTEPLKFAYSAADITVPDGKAFRGWFLASGKKFSEGTAPEADLQLFAHVTPVEEAAVGASFKYPLNNQFFYAEDHECFNPKAGQFHDAQHGWDFTSGNVIEIPVAGKAYVQMGLCMYSADSEITVTDADGKAVDTFAARFGGEKTDDGKTYSFFYDGEAPTVLSITFGGTTYVHEVNVYNVASAIPEKTNGYYTVPAGDASTLLLVLMQLQDGDKVFLPNGTYDLDETVLTQISRDNISLIGESMEGTIIRNAPDKSIEGIGTTATLYVTGNNFYMQDITLRNDLDYYNAGSAGRAVCLWDKGDNNVYKNVRMLSYQDTYYSNNDAAKIYWETSEIHGTVDFICGGGDVMFKDTKLVVEKRKADGTGACTITAPTTTTEFGYVFDGCTIESFAESYNLGRSWQNQPKCVYLNTTMNVEPSPRWTAAGMNSIDPALFAEYNSRNAAGEDVTPAAGTTMTFTNKNTTLTTVLTAEEAAKYTIENIYGEWAPDQIAAQTKPTAAELLAPEAEAAYLVDGVICVGEISTEAKLVRKANGRGGFGPAVEYGSADSIEQIDETADTPIIYNMYGKRLSRSEKGFSIENGKKVWR